MYKMPSLGSVTQKILSLMMKTVYMCTVCDAEPHEALLDGATGCIHVSGYVCAACSWHT